MKQPVQRFLVGERVAWRAPSIDIREKGKLFMWGKVIKCFCKYARSELAEIIYTLALDSEVWSETEWRARDRDLFRRMPKGGKLWTRALALKKKRKKR